MKNDLSTRLSNYGKRLQEPENLFSGKRLPAGFAPPDNILVFFHDFLAAAPNSHGRWTLVLPLDQMTYCVDEDKIELSIGEILLIPPHAMRFLHPASAGYRRLFLTFDDPGMQRYLPKPGVDRISTEAMRALWRFLSRYLDGTADECSMELMNFLCQIQTEMPHTAADRILPQALIQTVAFIESHLSSRILIKELAETVGLSESHLRMIFRKEMGISLGRFWAGKRLAAAQYRLRHSGMSLTEIADSCGFANVYVFGAFFKKNTGISPLKYRKTKGRDEENGKESR